ncbi:MAG: hypothetical protein V1837_07140 [Candidatus Woesearchaeota archaeon]
MKSQIKMGETIAILIIFFFLVVFGFSFYVRMQTTAFDQQGKENIDLRSIQTAQKFSFLPELQKSVKGVQTDNCFDLLKIAAFTKLLNESDAYSYYRNLLGYAEFRIKIVYPGPKEFLIFSPNVSTKIAHNLSTLVPVSVYNATADSYAFGVLMVNVYG